MKMIDIDYHILLSHIFIISSNRFSISFKLKFIPFSLKAKAERPIPPLS